MPHELAGRRVALLAADGVEEIELTMARTALEQAGARVDLLSVAPGQVQAFHGLDRAGRFPVDRQVAHAAGHRYDALYLPGGLASADTLRVHPDAVRLVGEVAAQGKPIGAVGHAVWLLIEAGLAPGRVLTGAPGLATDLCNAGGCWIDPEIAEANGVLTGQGPGALPDLVPRFLELVARQPARPEPERADDLHDITPGDRDAAVDVATADSFPASDPPSSLQVT